MTGNQKKDRYNNVTHIILDEVHEREINTDLLLITIKRAIQENPWLKVILMSATLDADKLCEYFTNCPKIDVPGRMYDVQTLYLESVLIQSGYQTEPMQRYLKERQCTEAVERENTTLAAYQLTVDTSTVIDHNLLVHVVMHIHDGTTTDGSILVFLPGYQDILEQYDLIVNQFEEKGHQNYKLFVLHSSIEEENANVFDKMPHGIRKIILSTNIAETSLTIDDVVS